MLGKFYDMHKQKDKNVLNTIEITTDDNIFDDVIRGNISSLIEGQKKLLFSIGRLSRGTLANSLNMSEDRLQSICDMLEIEVDNGSR